MILCIDCGNTRLKWGLRRDGSWHATGSLSPHQIDQLGVVAAGAALSRVVACNVAGDEIRAAVERVLPLKPEWIQARPRQGGVTNRYDPPAQLGADRWAALMGAQALHRGPKLVVCAGTATTIDLLDRQGVFEGGLILPGLDLMRASLAERTARLAPDEGNYADLPRNTRDAITSGALHATLGAIERMYRRIADQNDAICLLAGGAAVRLETVLELPFRRVDTLVLDGLAGIVESPAAVAGPD